MRGAEFAVAERKPGLGGAGGGGGREGAQFLPREDGETRWFWSEMEKPGSFSPPGSPQLAAAH